MPSDVFWSVALQLWGSQIFSCSTGLSQAASKGAISETVLKMRCLQLWRILYSWSLKVWLPFSAFVKSEELAQPSASWWPFVYFYHSSTKESQLSNLQETGSLGNIPAFLVWHLGRFFNMSPLRFQTLVIFCAVMVKFALFLIKVFKKLVGFVFSSKEGKDNFLKDRAVSDWARCKIFWNFLLRWVRTSLNFT